MEPLKVYKLHPKQANQMFLLAGIKVASYIVLLNIGANFLIFLGLAIFYVIIGVMKKDQVAFKTFPKYFEMKLAPLASKQLIKYDSITKLDKLGNKIVLHYTNEKQQSKHVKIPFQLLIQEDLDDFQKFLEEKLNPISIVE